MTLNDLERRDGRYFALFISAEFGTVNLGLITSKWLKVELYCSPKNSFRNI